MQETHITTTATKQPEGGGADTIYSSETVATGQESSVEITQSAKGDARVCVKVWHADPKEAALQAIDVYENTIRILRSKNL